MSTVVTKLVAKRYPLMITAAAAVRSLRVLRIRDARRSSGVSPCVATSGIIDTPVSKPDKPRTSNGNAKRTEDIAEARAARGEIADPGRQRPRLGEDPDDADDDYIGIEGEESHHQRDRDDDGFAEAEQEDTT